MPTCLVVGCQSGSGNGIDKQYKYGSTPLPKSPEIRYVWLEKINRLDYKFVDKARICFRHFYEDDFIPQSENLGARGKPNKRRQLKPGAMPSLYLSNDTFDQPNNLQSEYEMRSNVLPYVKKQKVIHALEVKNEITLDGKSIQVKCEKPELEEENYSESNFSVNPWDVSDPAVFLKYCCPECDFKCGELLGFSQHAVINHVLSTTLFSGRNFPTNQGMFIENDRNPNGNSYEFEDHDIKSESFELDNFVESEEMMKLEPNIEINSSDGFNLKNQFRLDKKGKKRKIVDKGTYICENCGFTADTLGRLKRHVDVMHQNSLNCSHCDLKFPQIMHLEYHIEAQHPGTSELKYFCSECGDGFMFQRNMERHLRKHKKMNEPVNEKKKNQKCSICGKRFSRRQFLRKHIEKVHEIPKASIKTHMETFNETNSISIDGAPEESTKNEGNLIKVDTSEDPIENSAENDEENKQVQNPDKTDQLCSKCGQHFTSLIELAHHFFKEHKKLGEDFDCPMCPKMISTKDKSSVMEHIRNSHLNETKKCPECKQILKLSTFNRHRQLIHGIYLRKKGSTAIGASKTDGRYECPACKKILLTKGSK